VNSANNEELALTMNGRKKNLKKQDFVTAMNSLKVEEKQRQNIFNKMARAVPKWIGQIDLIFMDLAFKDQYKAILKERLSRMQ
jgi:serine/threonine-protein kinase HipA